MTKKFDVNEIQAAVRKKYRAVSQSASARFQYPTGREGVVALEYDLSLLDDLPDEVLESFCGVGNPFSLGSIKPEEALLDVGCGAGVDLIVASRLVGPRGRVCGIDLTPEMVHSARMNVRRAGVPKGEVIVAGSEAIPFAGGSFDVVISNGVLNLSPEKEKSFGEIYRVLKTDGRLQLADVVLKEDLPPEVANSLEAWSEWVGGAIPVRDLIQLLKRSGFAAVEYVGPTGFTTSRFTIGAMFRARKGS